MNADNRKLEELESLVFEGDLLQIDDWFDKNKKSKNSINLKDIPNYILNRPYFYSFRSNSTQKKELETESQKRHIAIIKHFDLPEQLELIWNLCVHHEKNISHVFSFLKYSSKDKIKDYSVLSQISMNLFQSESFEQLDILKGNFNIDILLLNTPSLRVHYREKNMTGSFMIKIDNINFSPIDNIILNFSIEKKEYLEKNKYSLPSRQKVEKIKDYFLTQRNIPNYINVNMIYERLEEYEKFIFHDYLETIIHSKEKEKKLKL